MARKTAENILISRARLIGSLVLVLPLVACTWTGPQHLPKLDQPYYTEYLFSQEPELVWRAVNSAVEQRGPVNLLVRDPANRLIAWTEKTSWQSCNRSVLFSGNPDTVAVTVAHLRLREGRSSLTVRTSCYLGGETDIEHGSALGHWEREFVRDVRRRAD